MITLYRYQDEKVGVLGLAKAGTATAASLLAGGAEIFAWDDNPESRIAFARQFPLAKAQVIEYTRWPWKELAAIVPSPGIPLTHSPHPAVGMAREAGIRITGDIELLHEAYPHARKIGITGTNGKSTTTALIGHILHSSGIKVETGGNLGTPALSLLPFGADGCYVLELSSYQLDLLETTRFNIALLLNISPDHLNRHGGMEGYVEAKTHIFDRQTASDVAIVGIDDDYSRSVYSALKQTSKAKLIGVSVLKELKRDIFVDKEGKLHDKMEGEQPPIKLQDLPALTGRHNWQNAAFAYAACKLYGLASRDIEKGLRTFPGLRHRLQTVATIAGVRFINDSKATNADATSHALAPFNPIYWIAGGKAKEGGITSLTPFFPQISHAFLIGEAEEVFSVILEGRVPYTRCGTLANAFEAASQKAFEDRKRGAVVLLSPACASFDQWKNFEERGDAFCTLTEALLEKVMRNKK